MLDRDWSYAEIAASQGVSRAAVYDLVRRCEGLLEDFEARLELGKANTGRDDAIAAVHAKLDLLESEVRSLRKSVKAIH